MAHAEIETYSVLTRLPPPFRAQPSVVADYLRRRHPGPRLVLPPSARGILVERLASDGLTGGVVYDALIAATAAHHDHPLVTCDQRAVQVYERVGAAFELIR